MKPERTEVWEPVPKVVTPATATSAPSDAIVLFDDKSLDQWAGRYISLAKWTDFNNELMANKQYGNIETKRSFTDYQVHLEWKAPANITGEGQ